MLVFKLRTKFRLLRFSCSNTSNQDRVDSSTFFPYSCAFSTYLLDCHIPKTINWQFFQLKEKYWGSNKAIVIFSGNFVNHSFYGTTNCKLLAWSLEIVEVLVFLIRMFLCQIVAHTEGFIPSLENTWLQSKQKGNCWFVSEAMKPNFL